jgi:hypothetical protein
VRRWEHRPKAAGIGGGLWALLVLSLLGMGALAHFVYGADLANSAIGIANSVVILLLSFAVARASASR